MKQGWEIKKLGDIYDVRDGTHDSPKYQSEGYPLITSKNLKNDILSFDNINYISEQDYIAINKRSKVNKGDILFAMIGTIGNPVVVKDEPNYAIKNVALFKVPKEQNSNFLKYYLASKAVVDKMMLDAKGTTQKFVGLGYLRAFPITLPPLSEQKRIVAILDEAFKLIDNGKLIIEKNLKNSKELFDSYLQSVFTNKGEGWEEKPLVEVCNFRNGQAHEQYIDEEGKYILINSKFISSNGEIFKRTNNALSPLYKGDIVFVMSDVPNGKALAKCFLVDKDDIYTLNQRIGAINSKAFIPKFLFYQFNRNKYLLSFDNGENQTNLRKGDILKCPLFVPSLEEQQAIIDQLDALQTKTQKLEAIYRKKTADLEELKKSILKKAFNGEL